MADIKKSELSKVSKEELATVIARYKKRDQKSRMQARRAAEQLTADLVTVGSGAGLGYLMGSRIASVENDKLGNADPEAVEEALKEKTQIAGIDLDLAIAGTAAALGLTDMAGNMSDFLRNVGIGGLTAYGSRKAFFMAIEARDKELGHGGKAGDKPEFSDRFQSGRFGHFGGRAKPPK